MKDLLHRCLNQLPATRTVRKLIASRRARIFDEFLKFREHDTHVTTLNLSSGSTQAKAPPAFVMTWREGNNFTQTLYGQSTPATATALFHWHRDQDKALHGTHYENLPFADETFEWVFCEAVIEHMSNHDRQYLLLKELMRVARKGVFITTSNRWHPIEFYTALPLLHWLPTRWWKRVLRFFGKGSWASESMLNLLDVKALQRVANRLPKKPPYSIGHVRLMGLKAYFFLQIRKNSAAALVRSW